MFVDVPQNHWAAWAVGNMAQAGVLVGYPDGQFHGNDPVNHYQLASVFNQFTTLASQGKLPVASRSEWNSLSERLARLENQYAIQNRPYGSTFLPQRQWWG